MNSVQQIAERIKGLRTLVGKTPEQMAKDETVIEKVLSEDSNRDYVINRYLAQINERQVPVAMPVGGSMPIRPSYKPSSIKEAGELAKLIIERL